MFVYAPRVVELCTTTAYYSGGTFTAPKTLPTSAFTCCDVTKKLCCSSPSGDVCCRGAATAGSVFASGFKTVANDFTMVTVNKVEATPPTFDTCGEMWA